MSRTRAKMPVSQRAKQFMPFDAVSGLQQALRAKEHEMGLISRSELSDETRESINVELTKLESGDFVSVTYFSEEGSSCITTFEETAGSVFEGGLEYASEYDEESDAERTMPSSEGELKTSEGSIKKIDGIYRMLILNSAEGEQYINIDDIVGIGRK